MPLQTDASRRKPGKYETRELRRKIKTHQDLFFELQFSTSKYFPNVMIDSNCHRHQI